MARFCVNKVCAEIFVGHESDLPNYIFNPEMIKKNFSIIQEEQKQDYVLGKVCIREKLTQLLAQGRIYIRPGKAVGVL